MNNEDKILSALEVLGGRIDALTESVSTQFSDVNKRLDKIEDDVLIVKEETAVTRGVTDQLLECWVERFGDNEFAQVVALSDVAS